MDPNIVVGLVAAIATIIAAIIGAITSRRSNESRNKENSTSAQPSISKGNIIVGTTELESVKTDSAIETYSTKEAKDERGILELNGVLHVLQERLLRRIVEQLDPSVRRYETMQAVEEGCKALVSKIKQDKFVPDVIIGWRDPENEYQGSQTIAKFVAQGLRIPYRILAMKERDEKREVIEDCQWIKSNKKILVIDDACYSGSTCKSIQTKLSGLNPRADIRFAVLSALNPHQLPNLYYVSIHKTEELLFPWGWSRLIVGFYDIYKLFGISDRHAIWHESKEWGMIHTLAKNFTGHIRLISIESKEEFEVEANREFDTFLYFLNGSAGIRIGNKTGIFKKEQYIFLPRSIGYVIKANNKADILELSSDGRKTN